MDEDDIRGDTASGSESDHQELGAEAEREAEDLKHQGDKLDDDIEAAKADWEHKKEDQSVPGAVAGRDPALPAQSESEQDEPAQGAPD